MNPSPVSFTEKGDIAYPLCFQPKVNVELSALYRFRCFPFLYKSTRSVTQDCQSVTDGRICREFLGGKERMDDDNDDWTGNRAKVRIGNIGKRPAVRRTTTGLMGGSRRSSSSDSALSVIQRQFYTGYLKLSSTTKDTTRS